MCAVSTKCYSIFGFSIVQLRMCLDLTASWSMHRVKACCWFGKWVHWEWSECEVQPQFAICNDRGAVITVKELSYFRTNVRRRQSLDSVFLNCDFLFKNKTKNPTHLIKNIHLPWLLKFRCFPVLFFFFFLSNFADVTQQLWACFKYRNQWGLSQPAHAVQQAALPWDTNDYSNIIHVHCGVLQCLLPHTSLPVITVWIVSKVWI